ncbi:hypothetical protein Pst134EA_032153 [Puccinia striiformis f. sp. tritici]|uniref:uncharacterized protein n=1 Tax=Puccinia striiformis f. sp. tritici TaxID=168172 RepID=UPI002008DB44|nr:uncharacterized protein Pst134EA_032153 [Puccinia striiformis f. sp. tritici]KAH9440646.1 hypothetical protein Pst134EA_032153 [Puccinia striiformis f. sp. tritici]
MEGAMELDHANHQPSSTSELGKTPIGEKWFCDVDPDYLPYCRLQSEMEKDERRRFMIAILCQEFQGRFVL